MIIDSSLRCLDCGSPRVRAGTGPVACPPELARARRSASPHGTYSSAGWLLRGINAIEAAAASGVPFQAYDLERLYGLDPKPSSHGVLFNIAQSSKMIQYAGTAPSGRPGRRGDTQLWKASPDLSTGITEARARIQRTIDWKARQNSWEPVEF